MVDFFLYSLLAENMSSYVSYRNGRVFDVYLEEKPEDSCIFERVYKIDHVYGKFLGKRSTLVVSKSGPMHVLFLGKDHKSVSDYAMNGRVFGNNLRYYSIDWQTLSPSFPPGAELGLLSW